MVRSHPTPAADRRATTRKEFVSFVFAGRRAAEPQVKKHRVSEEAFDRWEIAAGPAVRTPTSAFATTVRRHVRFAGFVAVRPAVIRSRKTATGGDSEGSSAPGAIGEMTEPEPGADGLGAVGPDAETDGAAKSLFCMKQVLRQVRFPSENRIFGTVRGWEYEKRGCLSLADTLFFIRIPGRDGRDGFRAVLSGEFFRSISRRRPSGFRGSP